MKILQSISQTQQYCKMQKQMGKVIGLVPTMGYLHEGHISLVEAAVKQCDVVIASIFVNPIQFGIGEDFEVYPRDAKRDQDLLTEAGVDLLFMPSTEEMYPDNYNCYIELEGDLPNILCGLSRPGHFKGVTTVVGKLFNICQPDFAFFGQKDAQQVTIIEKMVRDLNFPVKIVRLPIIREADGLAMSSRNVYLDPEMRKQALILKKSLDEVVESIKAGVLDADFLKVELKKLIAKSPEARIDYVSICDAEELSEINDEIKGKVLIALAVKFGSTRLIDNCLVEV